LSATAHVPSDVETYLARVRAALADVPVDERNDLLAEVEASLYETASETSGPVAARLGPAEDFAAELRSAAGLHTGPARNRTSARETLARLAESPRTRAAGAILRELAPIWWVARAYIAVAGLALLFDASWSSSFRAVPRIGNTYGGLVLISLASVASIAIGLRGRRSRDFRPLLIALNVVLLLAAITVVHHLPQPTTVPAQTVYATDPTVLPGLVYNGAPVDNIYPYSRKGRLLLDVLLFTGAGAPVDTRPVSADPLRRAVKTRAGKTLYNVYPIRYYESGTHRVLRPKAGPHVLTPRLATPALDAKRR
jgi:hypothetical protein